MLAGSSQVGGKKRPKKFQGSAEPPWPTDAWQRVARDGAPLRRVADASDSGVTPILVSLSLSCSGSPVRLSRAGQKLVLYALKAEEGRGDGTGRARSRKNSSLAQRPGRRGGRERHGARSTEDPRQQNLTSG